METLGIPAGVVFSKEKVDFWDVLKVKLGVADKVLVELELGFVEAVGFKVDTVKVLVGFVVPAVDSSGNVATPIVVVVSKQSFCNSLRNF